jgi:hypothetical protein
VDSDRVAYIELCRRMEKLAGATIEGDLAQTRAEIVQMRRSLLMLLRRERGLAAQQVGWRERRRRKADTIEAFNREYDALRRIPGVVGISVADHTLIVRTAPLEIRHRGTAYPMGRYVISVVLPTGQIRIANLDHLEWSNAHPHVAGNGEPCLGNLTENVAQLIARHEYGALFTLLVAFLKTYNPDNPYSQIGAFSLGAGA